MVNRIVMGDNNTKYEGKWIAGVDPYREDEYHKGNPLSLMEVLKGYSKVDNTKLYNMPVFNYNIVRDKTELDRFIKFLPDLQPHEKFYYSLFARKKYGATEGLKSDKCQLKRGTTTKERMYRDFKKLEVQLGAYEFDGLEIKQESLVMYITPNPRDMHKAALLTASDIITNHAHGRPLISPQATALSIIQVTGRKKYFNIDVDFTEDGLKVEKEGIKNLLISLGLLNENAMTFIATRGGFHILVELEKVEESYKKTWYRDFMNMNSSLYTIDLSNGDGMLPIPGCVQSNFIPYIL